MLQYFVIKLDDYQKISESSKKERKKKVRLWNSKIILVRKKIPKFSCRYTLSEVWHRCCTRHC